MTVFHFEGLISMTRRMPGTFLNGIMLAALLGPAPGLAQVAPTGEKTGVREIHQPGWLSSAIDDRLSGREPLFWVSPGVTGNTTDLGFQKRNGADTMLTDPFATGAALDISFSEFQIGSRFGIGYILHTTSFQLRLQNVAEKQRNVLRDQLVRYSEGDAAVAGETRDLGSNVNGYSSMLVPFLYYGKPGREHFRIGGGIGAGRSEIEGRLVADTPESRLVLIDLLNHPSHVGEWSRANLIGNRLVDVRNLDPISLYLYAKIDQDDNLETLGRYWLATGRVEPRAADHAYMRFFNGDLSPLELTALQGLSHDLVGLRTPLAPAYMLFAESPGFLGGFKFRLAVEGLFFEREPYLVNLTVASLALYYPIPIRL